MSYDLVLSKLPPTSCHCVCICYGLLNVTLSVATTSFTLAMLHPYPSPLSSTYVTSPLSSTYVTSPLSSTYYQWDFTLILHPCSYVTSVTKSRNAEEYSLSMELVTASTSTILALKIPIDSKIQIVFHYKQCFSLVKKIKGQ